MIVRSVRLEDLDELWALIEQATYGMTTLQIDRKQLVERVELSHFAFNRQTEKPSGEPYVFVMEDTTQAKLVGLSCIFSKTGGYEPFYSYRRVVESAHSELLKRTQRVESLHLEKIHDGPTEIGSLFLLPEYRGQGRGRPPELGSLRVYGRAPQSLCRLGDCRDARRDDRRRGLPLLGCDWQAFFRH
uniref:arginine N-succinyltransferase n=1 Tax=Aureliella helgolandensis TaxID=2527968 RepID=UPI00370432FD